MIREGIGVGGLGWIEQTTTWQAERTIDGFVHVVRLFRVWGFNRQAIIVSPASILNDNGIGLPVVNDRRSQGDTISLESGEQVRAYHQILRPLDDPRFTDVEYRYTNDPRLIATTVEDNISFQTEYMVLPVAQKSERLSLGAGSRSAYVIARQSFPYTVGRLMRQVVIRVGEYFDARTVVRKETNKLHTLPWAHGPVDGTVPLYRFEGGDFTRFSPSFYLARYSWWLDGGHQELTLLANDQQDAALNTSLPPADILFYNVNWVRPPYHSLEAYRVAGASATAEPAYVAYLSNVINEDGWTGLVGLT